MTPSKWAVEREQVVHLRRAGLSLREVAEKLGRSKSWVNKWWKRYQKQGWTGLTERSRVPKRHGRKLRDEVRQAICVARSELEAEAAKDQGLKYIGARAVKTRLKDKGIKPLPSRASIERVLNEFEMTRPKQKVEAGVIH